MSCLEPAGSMEAERSMTSDEKHSTLENGFVLSPSRSFYYTIRFKALCAKTVSTPFFQNLSPCETAQTLSGG